MVARDRCLPFNPLEAACHPKPLRARGGNVYSGSTLLHFYDRNSLLYAGGNGGGIATAAGARWSGLRVRVIVARREIIERMETRFLFCSAKKWHGEQPRANKPVIPGEPQRSCGEGRGPRYFRDTNFSEYTNFSMSRVANSSGTWVPFPRIASRCSPGMTRRVRSV